MGFMDRLQKGDILFDGAFGTMLMKSGLKGRLPGASQPHKADEVLTIHRAYVKAGANAVETNTLAQIPFPSSGTGLRRKPRKSTPPP